MMNRVIQFAVVGALASVAAISSASAQTKFAYINSRRIMESAPGREEAEKEFGRQSEEVQKRIRQMQDSMNVMMDAYDKEAPKLDSAARMVRETSLRTRQEGFQREARALDSTLQVRQNDLARPLMEQVAKVLDEIRAKGGYAMIFDVASASSVVVSADTTLDITQQVLARLKELGPPKPTASIPAGPPPGPMRPSSSTPRRP